MFFRQIPDERLAQYAYLIACQQTGEAVVIDPERDVDRYIDAAAFHGYEIVAVTETHIHADFLSGARELAERLNVRLYLSDEGDEDWKYTWGDDYDVQFLRDGDTFQIGNIRITAIHTPGHTPEHLSFEVTDHGAADPLGIVTGDFVFVGDLGRPDLLESAAGMKDVMKPSAQRLFGSAQSFLELQDGLQVWPGHGAGSACGKSLGAIPQSTVGYERRQNSALIAVRDGEEKFVDAILADQTDPPLYFARMKHLNKTGPPLLGELPRPRKLAADELDELPSGAVLLDTRTSESEFMKQHLKGAQLARFDKTFPTVVGSLIADPDTELILAIREGDVEEAVRALVRIGYDHVTGYVPLAEMEAFLETSRRATSIKEIDFKRAEELREAGLQVVDVRYLSEYNEGHMPDAIAAPYTRLPEYVDQIPTGETLVVHCSAGVRSAVAASFLSRMGWDVRYVNDEFESWAEQHALIPQ